MIKKRPLMPLKLGPIVQRPNLLGEPSKNPNGQQTYVPGFNQGNAEQYNNLTSPTYQQYYSSQRNQFRDLGSNQSSPQLQPMMRSRGPSDASMIQQSPNLSAVQTPMNYQQQDTLRLPPINQPNNYQRSRFAGQQPIMASPQSSHMGHQTPQYIPGQDFTQQMNYGQMTPLNIGGDTTQVQNQRLTQLGAQGSPQQTVQYINGQKITIKSIDGPVQAQYGADEFMQTKNKNQKKQSQQFEDTAFHRSNRAKFTEIGLNDTGNQRSNKKNMTLARRSQRNIDQENREEHKKKNRKRLSQDDDDNFDDDEDDDEEEEEKPRRKTNKSRAASRIIKQEDDDDEYKEPPNRRKSYKSRANTRVINQDVDENEEEEAPKRRKSQRSRANSKVFEDFDDNRSVKSRGGNRAKSRKQSMLSRKGDDDFDDNKSVKSRKNKSRVLRNEDFEDLEEFKPRKKTYLKPKDDEDEEEEKPQRKKTYLQKKTLVPKNVDEDDEEEKPQRKKTYLQKKTLVPKNNDDEEQQRPKSSRKKTYLSKKSVNNINSLKYLQDDD